MVSQSYTSGAHEVYVILGNSALVKCEIPSFVADFVAVTSWVDNSGNEFFPSEQMGTRHFSHSIGTRLLLFFQLLLKLTRPMLTRCT